MFKGIDVSSHNSNKSLIDWQFIKDNNNLQFIMLRAGYGDGNIDNSFGYNIDAINRIGIPVGVYWHSYAYTPDMAIKEAKHCLKAIKDKKVEYPIVFKFDRDSIEYALRHGKKITRAELNEIALAFVNTIKEHSYFPMIYANKDYRNNMFTETIFKDIDIWYSYPNKNADAPYGIWQYNTNGTIKGIENNIGLNQTTFDYKHMIRNMKLNNLKRR